MKIRKKVIVTGGAGYIGSHTCVELYNAGYMPIILDNFLNSEKDVPARISNICGAEIEVYEVDTRDSNAISEIFEAQKDIFAVIHFAAFKAVGESVKEPIRYFDNNIGSLVNMLDIMDQQSIMPALVFSSSCTVYGEPDTLPVTESSPIQPANSPYGYTKQVCERLIQDTVAAEKGLNAVTLRYFNPIGAHPSSLIGELPIGSPNNLVPFITQAAAGIREKLVVFGNDYETEDGTCIRDYIHVVDLARAHVSALDFISRQEKGDFNEIVNIGTGRGNSVLELIQTFEQVSGKSLNYEMGARRTGDVEAVWAAASEDENILGWKAELNLEDALRDAWNWQKRISGIK